MPYRFRLHCSDNYPAQPMNRGGVCVDDQGRQKLSLAMMIQVKQPCASEACV